MCRNKPCIFNEQVANGLKSSQTAMQGLNAELFLALSSFLPHWTVELLLCTQGALALTAIHSKDGHTTHWLRKVGIMNVYEVKWYK